MNAVANMRPERVNTMFVPGWLLLITAGLFVSLGFIG